MQLFFAWSTWLAAWIAGACAQRRKTTTTSRNMAHILYIGHPYYGQLTPVKTRYPLTNIMWPYAGSGLDKQ